MKPAKLKAAVLISGTGSNLKALIDAVESGQLALDIVRVVSNRAGAGGLEFARSANIPVSVISHETYPDRQAHDDAVVQVLEGDRTELVILAGYMRILGESFTNSFNSRMINLHPSLLPLYKGLNTYTRALNAGDHETGASIHIVTSGLDDGPVISQVKIPIKGGDDAESLRTRLAPLEHKLLVATVDQFCRRSVRFESGQIMYHNHKLKNPLQLNQDGTFQ
jgi:phosphoribosylglycinamide formyltransferase-1